MAAAGQILRVMFKAILFFLNALGISRLELPNRDVDGLYRSILF